MKDPYVLEDGTLKNLLGITDYNELNKAEKDIGYVKLLDIDSVVRDKCDVDLIKVIHKHIFEDIFEWAGEFRTVPVYKQEVVIPGLSLEYTRPENIEKELIQRLEEMNSINWGNKDVDETTKLFTACLARIWRVHPFRDGNTRTTLAFANTFAKQHGFEMDMSTILNNLGRIEDEKTGKITRFSVRDKFVLAALDKKDYPEPEHIERIIKAAILNGANEKKEGKVNNIEEK